MDVYPNDEGAVDALMASPFHALAALDARLVEVGFGSARLDTAWSGSYYAAALDVFHGLDYGRSVSYPWTFPGTADRCRCFRMTGGVNRTRSRPVRGTNRRRGRS